MEQINIYGKKINGKVEFSNKQALKIWLDRLEEGDEIVAKFNRQSDYKTNRQVRLTYACFRSLMQKTGYTLIEVKYLVKKQQGLCACHEIEGDKVFFCKSISDFTKEELSNFILMMDQWSTEHLSHPLLTNDDINFLKDEI